MPRRCRRLTILAVLGSPDEQGFLPVTVSAAMPDPGEGQQRKCSGSGSGSGSGTGAGAGAGTILMRSVTIFLMNSRKGSAKPRSQTSIGPEPRKPRRRKMPGSCNDRYSARLAKVIEALKRRTRFSRSELDALYKKYKTLTRGGSGSFGQSSLIAGKSARMQNVQGIDRSIFRELVHKSLNVLTEDCLIERMFCCWDRENESVIRLEPWIIGLDVILRGTLREKIEFCFKVYDLNNDGYITKDEIFQLFKNSLLKQPGDEDPDEGVRDLSEMALKKLDADNDGKISFRDYETAVRKEPLLLEAFGQCLPTEETGRNFLKSLQPK